MKTLLSLAIVSLLGATAFADIQDPPSNDFGPTRKLSRGIANIGYGWSELFFQSTSVNESMGNAAGWSYGPVRGIGRFFFRIGAGIYEVATFPFATTKGSYRPFYKPNVPWIHGGYEEFPPELGFETRLRYVTNHGAGYPSAL